VAYRTQPERAPHPGDRVVRRRPRRLIHQQRAGQ
jgi:hypothetical protein